MITQDSYIYREKEQETQVLNKTNGRALISRFILSEKGYTSLTVKLINFPVNLICNLNLN